MRPDLPARLSTSGKDFKVAEQNFADRLLAAIADKRTPLVVGLDPAYDQLPAAITGHSALNDANDAEAAVDAILEFSTQVLKVVAPHVAAVKINSAFFERYHHVGVEAYLDVVQEAAAHGLVVIGDVKRADIGNTSSHYAAATLEDPDFTEMDDLVGPDAITVNPYMGQDSLAPFLEAAREFGKGVFALVRTSNPGAADVQDVTLSDGTPLYMHVGKLVEKWGADMIGSRGYSSLGAVVGATNPDQLAQLRSALPHTLFLVPGLGAQGGTAADVAKAFKSDRTGAIINASRSIIYAYKDSKYADIAPENWTKAVENAVLETKSQLSEALGV